MNSFKNVLFLLLALTASSVFGWGEHGHKLIAKKSFLFIPHDMAIPASYIPYVTEHSVDPDNRKKEDRTEAPKHFMDIDFYAEYLAGTEVLDQQQLIAKYKDTVTKKGILPWATIATYKSLVDAFKANDPARIKLYMSDLAHYVGDAHQPMHTIENYNGQLTGQKNIHFRYESDMVDSNLAEIEGKIGAMTLEPVTNLEHWIFYIIHEANCLQPVLFTADKVAYAASGNTFNSNYYHLMWFYTKFVTFDQFNKASNRLAQLYYKAWLEGGKPKLTE